MPDVLIVACLPLNHVPMLLLDAPDYEASDCDICGMPIWITRKAIPIISAGDALKACTTCIGSHFNAYTKAVIDCCSESPQN